MHNILYSQLWLDLTGRYARVITNGMDVKEADRQLLIPIGWYTWYIWAPYSGEMDMHGMETPVILAGRYENHFYIVYADILMLKNLLRMIELHGLVFAFHLKLPKVYDEKKAFWGIYTVCSALSKGYTGTGYAKRWLLGMSLLLGHRGWRNIAAIAAAPPASGEERATRPGKSIPESILTENASCVIRYFK